MLTMLKLQRGEGKILFVSPEIRTGRKRFEKASSWPKFPLKVAIEAPQFLSPIVDIEEVQIAQEVEVIEEVQASEVELESLSIMLGVGDIHGDLE